jgi:polyphosphate kinase
MLVAPRYLRTGLLKLIHGEIKNHEAGNPARIRLKLNSLVDEVIIDALYRASKAGVPVDIWVRGICALIPGQPGLSDNITVKSVLGRYLEHSRIFWFENAGKPMVYIGSADMMHRNLDRRIEALLHITDPSHIEQFDRQLTRGMSDDMQSWTLNSEGEWRRRSHAEDGTKLGDVQHETMMDIMGRKRGVPTG